MKATKTASEFWIEDVPLCSRCKVLKVSEPITDNIGIRSHFAVFKIYRDVKKKDGTTAKKERIVCENCYNKVMAKLEHDDTGRDE